MKSIRILFLITGLVIVSIAAYFGYTNYKEQQDLERVNKNATPINEALEHLRKLRERNK